MSNKIEICEEKSFSKSDVMNATVASSQSVFVENEKLTNDEVRELTTILRNLN